jgi:RNA polymerase sigma-70 factor (ECF subfamily)
VNQGTELEHIIEGCRRNRRRDQKRLYELYCDAMYATSYRILGSHEDAEDALQEAFVDVFKYIKSFRGDSTIGAWIKTIVVRRALKNLKELRFTETIEENGKDVPNDFLDDLSGEYLEQLILSLPDGYRSVFLLIEVEGYKHKEVGEMLGISESGSKSQLSRAKQLLRKKLEKVNAI